MRKSFVTEFPRKVTCQLRAKISDLWVDLVEKCLVRSVGPVHCEHIISFYYVLCKVV